MKEVLSYTTNLVVPGSDRKANLRRQEIVRNPYDSNALKLLSTLTINRFRETFQQVFSRTLIYSEKLARISHCAASPASWGLLPLDFTIVGEIRLMHSALRVCTTENYRNIKNQIENALFASCEKRRWIKREQNFLFSACHINFYGGLLIKANVVKI